MDRIDTMRLFVRIGECGSFSRAADAMEISHPAASAAIRRLEERLGTQLLSRTTRHLELTADGAAYYERCVRLLADLEEADSAFGESAARPKGKLRVDVPSRVARTVIVPALGAFFERYPELEVELGVTDRPIDLLHEGVDCAVRVGGPEDPRLVRKEIGFLQQGNFASPAYLAKWGIPKRIADLAHHWAVNYASPLSGLVHEWEYVDGGEHKTIKMQRKVTVNNAEAYVASGVAGLGLVQIPSYDAREYVQARALVEVLPGWRAPPLSICVLYPHRRQLSRRVKVFAEWVAELFQSRISVGRPRSGPHNGRR